MLNYPRINEISYRIEGISGNDSNYRIARAELFQEEETEKWSLIVQRKEDDGGDFMQAIMSRLRGYQETVRFRVLSAIIDSGDGNKMSLTFVVEDRTEEEKVERKK